MINGGKATTDFYGYTKLSNATDSNDATVAATASAVKSAYDLANGKYTKPSGGIPASDLASGVVPSAYTSNPAMNGTASPGSGTAYALGNHVHPSDTSKLDVSAGVTNVSYDSSSQKLKQTINGTTTTIVTAGMHPVNGGQQPATTGAVFEALQTVIKVVDISSFSSLPVGYSGTNTGITAEHYVIRMELSNPKAQIGKWTITTSDNDLTITGKISGTTSATIFLGYSV